jgi:hypothetical protein
MKTMNVKVDYKAVEVAIENVREAAGKLAELADSFCMWHIALEAHSLLTDLDLIQLRMEERKF